MALGRVAERPAGERVERVALTGRTALPRRFFKVRVPGGTVRIKACELPDGTEKRYPEYEDVKRVARETGKSYREVYQIAKTTAAQS